MQTISGRIRFSLVIGLLLAVSGCSGKHHFSGYYPSSRYAPSSLSSKYSAPEPDRENGAASMHRATLKGYTVLGKRYYPKIVALGSVESGIASWYGPDFHGKKTANGETYNMYSPGTAAHKTLPMNTIVLVTHRETGAQVKARINDRGPFVSGRIIDLSYTAGKAIGLDVTGTAPVTIQVIEYDAYIAAQPGSGSGGGTRVAAAAPVTTTPATATPATATPAKTAVITDNAPAKNTQTAANSAPANSAKTTVISGFAVQLGSFKNYDGATKVKNSATAQSGGKEVVIQTVEFGSEKLHRVMIAGFGSKEEALRYKKSQ